MDQTETTKKENDIGHAGTIDEQAHRGQHTVTLSSLWCTYVFTDTRLPSTNNLVDIVLRLYHKQEELIERSLNIEEHCGPMQPDVAGLCTIWVRLVESSEMIRSCLRVV